MKMLIADKFPEDKLAGFKALGLDVTYEPDASADDLVQTAKAAQVLVVRSTEVRAATIDNASNLALILRAGAGVNTIDVAAASARGIYVANCPGKNSVAVAELAMGLLVAADRRIPQCTADLKAHRWNKKEYAKADGLKGRTLGIVGMGQIGRAVAERAKAFEMDVIAWSRSLTPEAAEEMEIGYCKSVEELCKKADAITVHLAQTPDTTKLFNAKLFAAMKPKAIFINTSRGGIVDQAALRNAMTEKGIRAALDVFETEPKGGQEPFADDFLDLDGLIGTHHIGASTTQAQEAIADEAIRIVREFARTGTVPNCVNIATHSPAKCQLIVRHHDRVGVLATVLQTIRKAGINVQEMNNTVFEGAKAAVAAIRLDEEPPAAVVKEIAALKDMVLHVDVKQIA